MKEDKNVMKTFAKNLFNRRVSASLTQAELAARVGVTPSTISLLESATYEPSNTVLVQLASVLDCSVDYLLGLTDIAGNSLRKQALLTASDTELLKRLWSLSEADRDKVISFCEFLNAQKGKSKSEATA